MQKSWFREKSQWKEKTVAQGESLFNVGDEVSISVGYSGNYTEIFQGYVSAIKPHENIEFSCEDKMWKLKQKNVTVSIKDATLKGLLSEIMPKDIPFDAIDAKLGTIRFTNRNVAYILKELRDTYGLYSWFRNGTLHSGLIYKPEIGQRKARFVFGENILNPYDLEYKNEKDVKIKIKAISVKPDNKREEVETGDEDGETRTLHFYNVPKSELKARAESEIKRLKYTGFYGGLKTFGEPTLFHGDIANIQDNTNPDRNGFYIIKGVDYETSVNSGFVQTLKLHNKA